jgi:formate/nitrite transporter FocA (FNT family)
MARHHKKYYRERPMSTEKKIGWAIVAVIFVSCFIFYFIGAVFINCIFHWPIRWDFGTCWHEQISPAQNKAAQNASNFVP